MSLNIINLFFGIKYLKTLILKMEHFLQFFRHKCRFKSSWDLSTNTHMFNKIIQILRSKKN